MATTSWSRSILPVSSPGASGRPSDNWLSYQGSLKMNRYLIIAQLSIALFSPALFGADAQQCGGVSGVTCEGNQFCNYPAGTCGTADVMGECTERPEVCTRDYRPVIGCDGRVYSNACMASAAGVSIKHPHSEPIDTTIPPEAPEEPDSTSGQSAWSVVYQGKVRAEGSIERRAGQWSVQEILNNGSTNRTTLRIRFSRSVRDALILATPYCTFSDHGPASAAYGYLDDRTVDFVYEWPCGFLDFAGLDFLVIR